MNAQLGLLTALALVGVLIGAVVWLTRSRRAPTGPGIAIGSARRALRGPRLIGRSDWRNQAVLPPDVVDEHAALFQAAGGAWEVQLRHGRHMYVNGWRSRHNRLRSGDIIALGSSGQAAFQFIDGAGRALSAAPTLGKPAGDELWPIGEYVTDTVSGASYIVSSLLPRIGNCQTYEATSPDGLSRVLLHESHIPDAIKGLLALAGSQASPIPHVSQLLPAFGVSWFDGATRHVVPEVDRLDRLSDAALREQSKEAWQIWAEHLVIGLSGLHAAGVALGLDEGSVMQHVGVAANADGGGAYWRQLGGLVLVLDRPGADLADVRAFCAVMARSKLLEAPSHVRHSLQAAARPGERIDAPALLRRLSPEHAPGPGARPASDGQGEHRVEVGHATSRGMLRIDNEDSLCALEFDAVASHATVHRPVLLAVADGMGGVDAGEVASALAIEMLSVSAKALFSDESQPSRDTIGAWVQSTVREINAAVVAEGAKNGTQMGSTLAFALIVDGLAHFGNVGDSRIYRWHPTSTEGSGDGLHRLVRDHSLVQSLVDAGVLTDEERYSHPERSLVLRSLGDPKTGVSDENKPLPLQPGDWLLICSDGLWEMVRDDAIRDVLVRAPNAQVACDRLVDLANANGGEDNISVAIGRYL
jgi:serine/threonine protein phosphatase PrpC